MQTELKIEFPTFITLPRKTKADKKVAINLNTFRNLHYAVSNNAKVIFRDSLADRLKGVVLKTPLNVTFRLFKGRNGRLDKSNVYSIASKFLYDALTEYGCIEDDNDLFIKTEVLLPTELDRENPRIEFTFKTIE